ncbi:MAG: hypothetical protein P8106_02770 [Gammaproteobacteria bacterium]|jgi:hypothetical protein
MDQDAFRKTYRHVNERQCAYEKSVLTNQCRCSLAERFCIAEREGVHCGADEGQQQCLDLLAALRQQARFALRTHEDRGLLPHGKAIRIQVGGLRGLHRALHPDEPTPDPIPDVYALISAARRNFGGLSALPYSEIMQQVAAYRGRPRRSRRR